MNKLIYSLVILFLVACYTEKQNKVEVKDKELIRLENKYAAGFSIQEAKDFKVITLNNPWKGEETPYQYVLYKNEKPQGYENAIFVKIPIQTIACMSLTHVAMIDRLQKNESIIALSGCSFVSNPIIKNRIKENKIFEIGQHQQLNYEKLIERYPDVVMVYGIDESSKKHINKLKELGLKVILNAEYMENHPLGQAEWLKFVASFYDMNEESEAIFDSIENQYNVLKAEAVKMEVKPYVFVGIPWNGVWYLAGGQSFQAQLLKDAGANYLWKDNTEKSNFSIDTEVIIEKALDADFWINLNTYESIEQVVSYDEKFKQFKAVKEQKLYNN
ncbi:MAG: ABC transporter substrate-binding protein, partial [Flavobacteriales bacterium]|nr:ABC transporter substrate-binding protein [Flavobacteriales bacterium]